MTAPTHALEVRDFATDELSSYHKNPRKGDVDAIARSLEINGQYRPIVVNVGSQTGRPLEVLAGNHTLAAARSLGWATVKATTVDVDDLAAARIVAADNRTADLGGYDDAALFDLLGELDASNLGLDGTGYDDDFLGELDYRLGLHGQAQAMNEEGAAPIPELDVIGETAELVVVINPESKQDAYRDIGELPYVQDIRDKLAGR